MLDCKEIKAIERLGADDSTQTAVSVGRNPFDLGSVCHFMVGCQNSGPLSGTVNIRGHTRKRSPKGSEWVHSFGTPIQYITRPSSYPLSGPKYLLLGIIYPQLRVQGGPWYLKQSVPFC